MRNVSLRWSVGASLALAFFFALPVGARADSLGENVTFHVNPSYDYARSNSVDATLRAVGTHAYWYVDDRYWDSITGAQQASLQSALDELSDLFDGTIYPRETSFWGSEATPGVDGDPHVTIVLERLNSGSGGYFETLNNVSRDRATDSNEREMLFVNVEAVDAPYAAGFVAHEFQHLISFNQKELLNNVVDDIWSNEARSEYAVTVASLNEPYRTSPLERRVSMFSLHPSDSLVGWPNTTTDYSVAAVFVHYVAEHYAPSVLAGAGQSEFAGIEGLNDALIRSGSAARFADIYLDWMAAVGINDPSQPQYSFRGEGLRDIRVTPNFDVSLSRGSVQSVAATAEDWQPVWAHYRLGTTGPDDLFAADIHGDDVGQFRAAYAYRTTDGLWHVVRLGAFSSGASVRLPAQGVSEVLLMMTQGAETALGDREVTARQLQLTAQLNPQSLLPQPFGTEIIQTQQPSTRFVSEIRDGDLIRRNSEPDIYVVAGAYKRFLPPGVLELYGFQNRPVTQVDAAAFERYMVSNYIRPFSYPEVYAAWPDGTKHWLNMTADHFTGSGRDWGAIFIVNDAETAWYRTGADITR